MKETKRVLLLHSLLPLVVSLIIYVLFRSRSTIVNKLLFHFLANKPPVLRLTYCRWIVYNLPGALWLYSFLSFSALHTRRWLSVLPLLLALGIEVLQYLHITDGRFDWLDVAFYTGAWLAFMAVRYLWQPAVTALAGPRPKASLGYKFAYGLFAAIVLLSDVWFK
ncbi:hypothetical protein [Hymenobacter metallicola]|uniref:VanZ family protein n=1 Tax=Hymenobacter metallicola TaxID=2563114 RepID=A0A4Z0QJ71_9BACT|nr:hypothetical protein [Hymenobacter metallicola]TGE29329.1 hypothetical protein E5K02_07705 [Hymenobacter metallicola]